MLNFDPSIANPAPNNQDIRGIDPKVFLKVLDILSGMTGKRKTLPFPDLKRKIVLPVPSLA